MVAVSLYHARMDSLCVTLPLITLLIIIPYSARDIERLEMNDGDARGHNVGTSGSNVSRTSTTSGSSAGNIITTATGKDQENGNVD